MMGKAARIKAEKAEAKLEQKVLATLAIELMEDGTVRVRGPIDNPVQVINFLAGACTALTQFYLSRGDQGNRIMVPKPGLILPGGN